IGTFYCFFYLFQIYLEPLPHIVFFTLHTVLTRKWNSISIYFDIHLSSIYTGNLCRKKLILTLFKCFENNISFSFLHTLQDHLLRCLSRNTTKTTWSNVHTNLISKLGIF